MQTATTKSKIFVEDDKSKTIPRGAAGVILAFRKNDKGFFYLMRFANDLEVYCPAESVRLNQS